MTDETSHADTPAADEHAPEAHSTDEHGGSAHGDDDHGHGGEALGPIDVDKWAFAIAGAVAGVIVLAFFMFVGLPA